MYFPDLTPYTYGLERRRRFFEDPPPTLNVGWLEPPHNFPTGEVTEEFQDKLFALCVRPIQRTRGYYTCGFCPPLDQEEILTLHQGKNAVTNIAWFTTEVCRHGEGHNIGSAEVHVEDIDSTRYAAPNLIYHYVIAHHYLPPPGFVRAVLDGTRVPDPDPRPEFQKPDTPYQAVVIKQAGSLLRCLQQHGVYVNCNGDFHEGKPYIGGEGVNVAQR